MRFSIYGREVGRLSFRDSRVSSQSVSSFLRIAFLGLSVLSGLLTGCASAPRFQEEISSERLFKAACEVGASLRSAQGTAWLKVASKEFSGQYSTSVQIPDRDHLLLRIDNILGGTEATITVDHQHYRIIRGEGRGDQIQNGEGNGNWGGIPLEWATALFLGRIPCPHSSQKVDLMQPEKGQLDAVVRDLSGNVVEKFSYTFSKNGEQPWPDTLHWERHVSKVRSVDFKFERPEERSGSPKKWEAHSVEGLVKVIWKDRTVLERAPN